VGSFVVTYSINESVWKSLPDTAKQAMEEAGKDTMVHLSNALDERELSEKQKVEELGIRIYTWSKEDLAKQTMAAKAVAETWAKKLDERGLGGTHVLELFMKALGL
jgi:TRAP-type C4-dicarboxylate transport system substrate-binding protein